MNEGFFDLSETQIQRGDEQAANARREPVANCETCGRVCEPFPVFGDGKKRVMVLVGSPSDADKAAGKLFSGYEGKLLRNYGFADESDYWVTAAVACYSPKPVNGKQVNACRKRLHKTVNELKPAVILVLGEDALMGLIGHKLIGRGLQGAAFTEFLDERIPDTEFDTRLAVTYDPRTWAEHERNPTFETSIKAAAEYVLNFINSWECGWYVDEYADYVGKCLIEDTRQQALNTLISAVSWEIAAFDYETTGLKPQAEGHRVYSMSISDGNYSWAFPIFQDDEFKAAVRKWLLSPCKKIMQGVKFETSWSLADFGVIPANVIWCTQTGAHSVHNTKKTNLKLATYIKFGIAGYDESVEQYLKPTDADKARYGANALNRIEQAPLQDLLLYNALDSLFTFHLEPIQREALPPHLQAGAEFFTQSAVELAKIESVGIHIDEYQLEQTKLDLTARMAKLERAVMDAPELRQWDKKSPFSLSAPADLTHLLFDLLKLESKEYTATGKPKGDKTSLEEYDLPIVQNVLAWRKLQKARDTYLTQFEREVVNGKIHPFYNLDRVDTFRSCVAKGSLVLAARDFMSNPSGVPIEDIRAGDHVYCFNSDLKLVLKKVLWAGKTGHKKVVRIRYKGAVNNVGYLDVTPEHRIRLVNGEYVAASELLNDYRDLSNPKWKRQPKCRALSCRRVDDRLFATNQKEILEHRMVYEHFSGTLLSDKEVIHHKDLNHFNHEYSNLEKLACNVEHASKHYFDTLGTESSRKNNISRTKQKHINGEFKHIYKYGFENPNSLKLTKDECLLLLEKSGGCLKKIPYDFNTFKKYCTLYEIDLKEIKFLFNPDGVFLSKEMVMNTLKIYGHSNTQKILKVSYYKLKTLRVKYGIEYERGFKNQNGFEKQAIVTTNNHVVIGLEYLPNSIDVYDLEIEDEHNFIANEICVHNSSDSPNFQNVPKRDKEIMTLIRRLVVAKQGARIVEWDYKGVEVAAQAVNTQDPELIRYVSDPSTDMHRDLAAKLFLRDIGDVADEERQATKNKFTFPTFYGSYWKNTSQGLWSDAATPATIAHLKSKGVRNFLDFQRHVESVENWFWRDKFPASYEYKEKVIHDYQKNGYIDLLTGFRCHAPLSRNQLLNYKNQGTGFHWLLWTLCRVSRQLEIRQTKSKMFAQIHDAALAYVWPDEAEMADELMYQYGTQKIREYWPWIIVPLSLEKSESPENGNWSEMRKIGLLKVGAV